LIQRNKVIVKIAGKDYTLVGTESDEYIQKIGLYVDRKMSEIRNMYSKLSTTMIAVLTATNIADDFYKSSEKAHEAEEAKKYQQKEIEKIKKENKELISENNELTSQNNSLQLELAKREAELREVRKISQK
jgi:cell division protein ZapA